MKRTLIGIVGAIVGLTVLIAPGTASAHHPVVVSSDVVCQQDGTWLISWTASPDATRGLTWWLTSPVNTSGTPVPDSQPIGFTTTAPGSATSASVTVSAAWSNQATGTRTGTAQFGESTCSETTTTTTTEPEVTTTTTGVERCDTTTTGSEECVTTTTTEPEATTTEPETTTTEPEVTTTTAPFVQVCYQHMLDPTGPTLQPGEFFIAEHPFGPEIDPGVTGSVNGPAPAYCGPIVAVTTTMAVPPTLPSTGSENWIIAAIASLLMLSGGVLLAVRR